MSHNVKIVMLTNNQVILAKVKDLMNVIAVENAFMPVPQPQGIGLVPWPMFVSDKAREEVLIDKKHVIFVAEADSEISGAYLKATTGIIVPKSSLIVQ